MPRKGRTVVRLTAACALGVMTAGCADTLPYPNVGLIPALKQKVMTQEEREEAIKAMQKEQQTHDDAAIRQIEQR